MNLNDAYPSKYLKAGDLPDEGSQPYTIESIEIEEVGRDKEQKPVIHFKETEKGLVCNKTNARSIARVLDSEEFEDWIGCKISLYLTEVQFEGDMVEAIRVKGKPAKAAKKGKKLDEPAAPEKTVDEDGQEIPF